MSSSDVPWDELVRRIQREELTPFLGAGISRPPLPGAAELAGKLADEEPKYPFVERGDLMQVGQYMATLLDGSAPKGLVAEVLRKLGEPDFDDVLQPHRVLASLPIPIYLTTNYDDFMERAIRKENRTPLVEICKWNSELIRRNLKTYLIEHDPDVSSPVVFHLHGHIDVPDSFVLTEDDYLDFIVNVRRYEGSPDPRAQVLPPKIHELISSTSLLFIGYGLRDWNLRVLLRALVQSADVSARKLSVSVQLAPGDNLVSAVGKSAAIRYLEKYFDGLKIKVFWGTAQEFLAKLKGHWEGR